MFLHFNQTIAQTSNTTLEDSTVHRPWYELGMMADPILDQSLLFYLSMTYSRQADIGECLQTASRINPTDAYSWAREWTVTAERLQLLAANAERDGFPVSAGELYMRSATYFSSALHRQNNPGDPMVFENTQSASVYFRKALELLDIPATPVQIQYENTTLPGYFFRSPLAKGKVPVLIVHSGRDGWALHCKYIADAAILRGYHCLLVDGPGQGEALRLKGLVFRPDWEKVITPIVDYLITQKDVDPNRIGLVGLSMGGSLAPRAVAFEKRIKVCVANPGVLSWPDIIYGFMGAIDPELATLWKSNPDKFNLRIAEIAAQVPLVDWGIRDMMWKHGSKSPAELMAQFQAYSNRDIVSKITCKMLVMDGVADDFSQGKDLYDALTCPKEYMLFNIDDPGLQHCQVGAQASSSERLFDWLDKNL
jgi:pimeloyl-ACP methyl ester carboxylesterase